MSPEPFQKFAVVGGDGGGWWSEGILEFRFGPGLGLRLEAGTKLNNLSVSKPHNFLVEILTTIKRRPFLGHLVC